MGRLNRSEISGVLLSTLLALVGCGSGEGGGGETTLGSRTISHSSCGDGCSSLDFSTAEVGSEWIVTPYILGESSVISGAGATTFDFAVEGATEVGSVGTGAGLTARDAASASSYAPQSIGSILSRDHALRSLYNHFDPNRGLHQVPWFWAAVADLDRKRQTGGPIGQALIGTRSALGPSISDEFLGQLAESRLQERRPLPSSNSTSPPDVSGHKLFDQPSRNSLLSSADPRLFPLQGEADCPASGKVPVPAPSGAYDSGEQATIVQKFAGQDFCLAVLSDLETAGTLDEVAEAMAAIMKRYKTVIYKDQMAPKGNFTMAPLIIVADFKDEFVWPPAEEGKLQVSGVLHRGVTEAMGRPVVYIASDLVKVLGLTGEQASRAKQLWYGTLAHEIQHAVMYYYREADGKGVGETPAVDEGIAHFMEDVFGYGLENFKSYAGAFLSVHPYGTAPFLDSGADVISNDTLRGATHTLLYYLSSQMGGVEFSGGEVSGGGGLDFIVSVVKHSSSAGAATLIDSYGSDWSTAISNYSSALVLDGNVKKGLESRFATQSPVADITQIGGGKGTFGMRFNGYAGLPGGLNSYELLGQSITGVKHYHLRPYRLTVQDPPPPSAALVFKLPDQVANTGVTAVQVRQGIDQWY